MNGLGIVPQTRRDLDGAELWVTVHPSYLLRLEGAARAEQAAMFAADLAAVKARLGELAEANSRSP